MQHLNSPSRGAFPGFSALRHQQSIRSWIFFHRAGLLLALLVGACFFAFNIALLHRGHFHEDAYILFIYVENVLNGFGFSYYPGGPPTEGATDFLWIWLLVLLGAMGIDVGTAAIALNALGVAIIVFIFADAWASTRIVNLPLGILLAPFLVLWLFSATLQAAVGGFSVFLYMALVLSCYVAVCKPKYILFTPYLGITVALFRPDGVIIGAGFTLLGCYIAYTRNCLRPYIAGCVVAVAIGVAYFIARYAYFGNLLPLPLYVKSSTAGLAGLDENISWLNRHRVFLYPLLLLVVLYPRKALRYLAYTGPVLVFFAILVFASQTQNVGFRFQGPLFILIYYVFLLLLLEMASRPVYPKPKIALVLVLLLFLLGDAKQNLDRARHSITRMNYINTFPQMLRQLLPEHYTFALTEAGRLAYWNQSGNELVDIVGLNNAWLAKTPVTVDYVAQLSPDIIMYHTDMALAAPEIGPAEPPQVLSMESGEAPVLKPDWVGSDYKVGGAVTALTGYLQRFVDSYDILLVDYKQDGSYAHVYALKKDLGLDKAVYQALQQSFEPENQLSYFAMKQLQSAD